MLVPKNASSQTDGKGVASGGNALAAPAFRLKQSPQRAVGALQYPGTCAPAESQDGDTRIAPIGLIQDKAMRC
jgi:hypothetical protein